MNKSFKENQDKINDILEEINTSHKESHEKETAEGNK